MLEHETGFVFWELITFAPVVLLLRRWAWPHVTAALRQREEGIRSSLDGALNVRDDAEETLRLARAAVADRDRVAATMLREMQQTAEELKHSIRSLAENRAGAILEESGREIQRLREEALRDLRCAVSGMIVDTAGRLIEQEMTTEHHHVLIHLAIAAIPSVNGQHSIAERSYK